MTLNCHRPCPIVTAYSQSEATTDVVVFMCDVIEAAVVDKESPGFVFLSHKDCFGCPWLLEGSMNPAVAISFILTCAATYLVNGRRRDHRENGQTSPVSVMLHQAFVHSHPWLPRCRRKYLTAPLTDVSVLYQDHQSSAGTTPLSHGLSQKKEVAGMMVKLRYLVPAGAFFGGWDSVETTSNLWSSAQWRATSTVGGYRGI